MKERAQQFRYEGDFIVPCAYASCAHCTPKLSDDPPDTNYDCQVCGAIQIKGSFSSGKVELTDVCVKDFTKALQSSEASEQELQARYDE